MSLLKSVVDYLTKPPEERNQVPKLGRNDVCWCGSGRKYKKCHLPEDEKKQAKRFSPTCGAS